MYNITSFNKKKDHLQSNFIEFPFQPKHPLHLTIISLQNNFPTTMRFISFVYFFFIIISLRNMYVYSITLLLNYLYNFLYEQFICEINNEKVE